MLWKWWNFRFFWRNYNFSWENASDLQFLEPILENSGNLQILEDFKGISRSFRESRTSLVTLQKISHFFEVFVENLGSFEEFSRKWENCSRIFEEMKSIFVEIKRILRNSREIEEFFMPAPLVLCWLQKLFLVRGFKTAKNSINDCQTPLEGHNY